MEKENKSCIISFRVTAEEKKWIEDRSYGHYQLISDFVRDCVFEKDIVIINGLDEFSAQLRRIGNNVNQIAYCANAQQSASEADIQEAAALVRRAWRLVKETL